jgi:23S rRNA pseudouridine2605 synthase
MPREKKQPKSNPEGEAGERLQKVLAAAGIGSRRQCEEYIVAGRVSVDGRDVHELGTTVIPWKQEIRVDGEKLKSEQKVYYLLNKPKGYLCTNNDPAGRARVIDLFPNESARLFTVGRLDENSQGLILVTNDGDLANRLAHPRYQVPRTYRVQVAGNPTPETLKELRSGLRFSDGKFRIKGIRRVGTQGRSTYLEIVLTEGHNREIRRLLARVGHKVIQLERISFGPINLGRVAEGKHRKLKPTELNDLRDLAFGSSSPRSASTKKSARRRKATTKKPRSRVTRKR